MADKIENLVALCERSTEKFAANPLFGNKGPQGWSWTTYGDFQRGVDVCRTALAAVGIGPGDRVAIVSNNSIEWATLAYATLSRKAIFVPMYEVQPAEEWRFILEDSGTKLVVGRTREIYDEIKAFQKALPNLEHVVGVELPLDQEGSWAKLMERGTDRNTASEAPSGDDIAGFIYTSGTTAMPKGVILSHRNICSNIEAVQDLIEFSPRDRTLAFLPWAHAFGQTAELHLMLSKGVAMAINDEVPKIVANLSEVQPTVLFAVPRIFNRIYDGVSKQMADKPAPIRKLFAAGMAASRRKRAGESLGMLDSARLALADKLVFSKIRAKFGGRLRFVVSGSAALNKDVANFIDALGIDIYEGYGLTETGPVVSVNYPGHRKLGSVGKPLPNVTVTIDTAATEDPNAGEVVVAGPNVMQGYYNRQEETEAVLKDGRLRTGDIGLLDEDGYLYITGRIKEQYKLENGKYVVPEPLEEQLKLSPYVANVMLHGANRPHNVALIVPDKAAIDKWAQENGVDLGDDMAQNRPVRELIEEELKKNSTQFRHYERPKAFILATEDFSPDNEMLTPSFKLKRRKIMEKYGEQLEALYER